MAKKSPKQKAGGKGFTTAQERSRKHINVTVAVIVALMAVIGIVGMALKTPESNVSAASGSTAPAASTQKEIAAAETSAAETVVAQSTEKSADETAAVSAAVGETQQAQTAVQAETENTAGTAVTAESAGLALSADGTYTLPENKNVYSTTNESGPVIAALYAGNQVQVGQSAGSGWYSVTVWVGSGGSYTQTTGYMKLQ